MVRIELGAVPTGIKLETECPWKKIVGLMCMFELLTCGGAISVKFLAPAWHLMEAFL
jgi:hypothetical protein